MVCVCVYCTCVLASRSRSTTLECSCEKLALEIRLFSLLAVLGLCVGTLNLRWGEREGGRGREVERERERGGY